MTAVADSPLSKGDEKPFSPQSVKMDLVVLGMFGSGTLLGIKILCSEAYTWTQNSPNFVQVPGASVPIALETHPQTPG